MPNGTEHWPVEPLDAQVRRKLERIQELENWLRKAQDQLEEMTAERDALRRAIALVKEGDAG